MELPIGEFAPGWRAKQPIPLVVERDTDGQYVVSDHVSTLYGAGTTEDAAYNDYKQALIEYFELVEDAAQQHPDSNACALLAAIEQYVERIPERPVWVLSEAQTKQFCAALLDPPKPSERMKNAAERYREMVEPVD